MYMAKRQPKNLPDTPWHIGYPKKKENDPRRHRSRCIYYDKKTTKCMRGVSYSYCPGSARCSGYREKKNDIQIQSPKHCDYKIQGRCGLWNCKYYHEFCNKDGCIFYKKFVDKVVDNFDFMMISNCYRCAYYILGNCYHENRKGSLKTKGNESIFCAYYLPDPKKT